MLKRYLTTVGSRETWLNLIASVVDMPPFTECPWSFLQLWDLINVFVMNNATLQTHTKQPQSLCCLCEQLLRQPLIISLISATAACQQQPMTTQYPVTPILYDCAEFFLWLKDHKSHEQWMECEKWDWAAIWRQEITTLSLEECRKVALFYRQPLLFFWIISGFVYPSWIVWRPMNLSFM